MTLADLIPSLRSSLPRRLEPGLWPTSASHLPGGDVSFGGASLREAATEHGTPTVVVDMADLHARCADLRRAFRDIDVIFTGGSLLAEGTAAVVQEEGLSLGIYCEAQLATAVAARFPVDRMIVHAAQGRPALVRRAASLGVGRVVIDNLAEIDALTRMRPSPYPQPVLVSIRAGTVDGVTQLATHRSPAHGFSVTSGEAAEALRRILACPGLLLVGVQCRIDAPVTRSTSYLRACSTGLDFVLTARVVHGVELSELHFGGGHDAVNHDRAELTSCETAAALRRTVERICTDHGISVPHLSVEPGTTFTGPASATLCRVTAVHRFGGQTRVEIDDWATGSVPLERRHDSRSVHLLNRLSPDADVHAEIVAADASNVQVSAVAIHDTLLPADIAAGDLLAVPGTGSVAHSALAHRTPRPALVAVNDGRTWPLTSRRSAQAAQLGNVG